MVILPRNNAVFHADAVLSRDRKTLHLSASIRDQSVRDLGLPHDGYETITAVIDSGNGQRRRVELPFITQEEASGPPFDIYQADVPLSEAEAQAVRAKNLHFEILTH